MQVVAERAEFLRPRSPWQCAQACGMGLRTPSAFVSYFRKYFLTGGRDVAAEPLRPEGLHISDRSFCEFCNATAYLHVHFKPIAVLSHSGVICGSLEKTRDDWI